MSVLPLPYAIRVLNAVLLDDKRGPYVAANEADAKALACIGVPAGIRCQGQDVILIIAGLAVVYAWVNGVANTDLIPQQAALPQGLGPTDNPTFGDITVDSVTTVGVNTTVLHKTAGINGDSALIVNTNNGNGTVTEILNLRATNSDLGENNFNEIIFTSVTPRPGDANTRINIDLPLKAGVVALLDDIDAALTTTLRLTPAQQAAAQVGVRTFASILKNLDGSFTLDPTVQEMDNFAPSTVEPYLLDTQPWGNITGKTSDYIEITGVDNSSGQVGQEGQEYEINSNFYLCKSHVFGTPGGTDGSAVWVRNRSRDCLDSNNSQDAAIIAVLTDGTGWNSNGVKIIANVSKVGSWYTGTSGNLYMCFDDSGGSYSWRSFYVTPPTDPMEITTGDHPILIASIQAHDFTTGFYLEGTNGTDETATQGQEYLDEVNNKTYKRNQNGYWAKISG